jgi:drug/metabolite transporter (DMT)-like permease
VNVQGILDLLRRNLRTVVRVSLAALVLLVVLGAVPAIVDKHHAHTKAEHLPGFWAAFGFLGCLLIFVFSKTYGHLGISRKEDYYGD